MAEETKIEPEAEAQGAAEVAAPSVPEAGQVAPAATPEVAAKAAPEGAPKATPEVAAKAAPEGAPKAAPEVAAKAAPEGAPKAAPEGAAKAAPEGAAKAAPEGAAKAAPEGAPASRDERDNRDDRDDRRGRRGRVVPAGVAHIRATFNNTIVTISDARGNVLSWSTSGKAGFKGSRKSTAFAGTMVAQEAARTAIGKGMHEVEVRVQGAGAGRESAVRGIQSAGMHISVIKDVTPIAHNGCRPRKRRRV